MKKGCLAEESEANKRSYNTPENSQIIVKKPGTEGSEGTSIEEEEEANQNIVIILPEIVRNFSEGKIDED